MHFKASYLLDLLSEEQAFLTELLLWLGAR